MGKYWLGQSGRFRAKWLSLLAFCLLAGASSLPAPAETPATPLPKQIGLLENRFFYHLYVQDPIEKRLERLELLVFGGTQAGSNEERLARLKKSVADRDTASAQSAAQGSKAPAVDDGPSKPPSTGQDKAKQSSGQYPILNTLEWRLLKKTYPDDSMDGRLERMETKVFGQASPAMAYIDRVERLKKTVGVGVAEEAPTGKMGPRPKARPRLDGASPQVPDGFGMMPTIPPNPFNNQRGMSPSFGDFNSMFRELNKQMQEMMRMPPGHYEYDPNSGEWTESDTGRKLSPDTAPPPAPPKKPKPLPYYDPNSI
jgi:hypothetical protein